MNDICCTIDSIKDFKGITVGHWNARSMFPKIDEIAVWLKQSEIEFLCITESWLHDGIPDDYIDMPYYCFVRSDRTAESGKQRGGGIVCYYRNRFNVLSWPAHTECTADYEILTLTIKLVNTRDWFLICVYRPPEGKVKSFCDKLELIVSDVRQKPNVEITVIGDVNINLFKTDNYVKVYKNCLR